MKHFLARAALSLALVTTAFADDLVRDAQDELKTLGFFYGEPNGVNGPETAAAVKRYQIRNGLEVTGTLNQPTLEALGLGGTPAKPNSGNVEKPAPPPLTIPERKAQPVEREAPRQPAAQPPINLRREPTEKDTDREYIRRTPSQGIAPGEPSPSRPPAPAVRASGYARLFAGTPYASAPFEVQQSTTQKAQRFLKNVGFYRDSIDGQASPATEEAILGYQRFIKLPLTGQLDFETLAAMQLLPGRGGSPVRPGGRAPENRPLRGVLIR